jgi:mandelate racemase
LRGIIRPVDAVGIAGEQPLTVSGLTARAVDAPMGRPIQTASGEIPTAALVLLDLHTREGVTGSAYAFCYTSAVLGPVRDVVAALEPHLAGRPLAPLELHEALRARFRLLGSTGLLGLALNAVDAAAWDALARAAELPLAALLGGRAGARVPAYGSLKSMRAADAAREAEEVLSATGVRELKVKVGAGAIEDDLAVLAALRDVAGDEVRFMVDYNQSLPLPEAIARLERLDAEGLAWVEEPVHADDAAGSAAVARAARTPIQTGESWWSPAEAARHIAAGSSDHVMLDVGRIGGVTGWNRAAALAHAAGLPVSSHIYTEVSAHLLAATPGAHRLEFLPDAAPVLREPLEVRDGMVTVPGEPGSGVVWDEAVVERHRVA